MCVALLIASEFMPISLLTPIAHDLSATDGMAGQAISISGLFAVLTSLVIATVSSRFDRRQVLIVLTATMLASLALIALAPNFAVLMAARALLGVTIGGFWSLATATIMLLVPTESVPKAVGVMYMGNAVATAVAAPIGSYLGGIIGWRGVFWALVPLVAANLVWLWVSIPALAPRGSVPLKRVLGLLRRRNVLVAMVGLMLTFGGAFAMFTYLRPFLEATTRATLPQVSLLLLGLGVAGFAGTYAASALIARQLYTLLWGLPVALAAVTLTIVLAGHVVWVMAILLFTWGALNSAVPVAWFNWLTIGIRDEPDGGGGLMVAAIQLAIMLGAALGGIVVDHVSVAATFLAATAVLVLAAMIIGGGRRLRPNRALPVAAGPVVASTADVPSLHR